MELWRDKSSYGVMWRGAPVMELSSYGVKWLWSYEERRAVKSSYGVMKSSDGVMELWSYVARSASDEVMKLRSYEEQLRAVMEL